MEEDLISKKELLEMTGISYGQLYRWKRKQLLPEDWFIRRSAFTGQETFFPRQQVLGRIRQIMNMKEGLSLDELADLFSPAPAEVDLSREDLLSRNIVSRAALEYSEPYLGKPHTYSFQQLLILYVFDCSLQTGQIHLEEGKAMLTVLLDDLGRLEEYEGELVLLRKMGMSLVLLLSGDREFYAEKDAKIALRIPIAKKTEELKLKLSAREGRMEDSNGNEE